MANQQIPNLPPAIALAGTEQLEAVQAGTSVRVTVGQLGGYFTNIVVDQTPVLGGTTGYILYDNGGVIGEYPVTGSAGSVVLSINPSLTAPVIGDATGTSLTLTGGLSARTLRATNGIITNDLQVASDFTIEVGQGGMSVGPITVNPGVVVTVSPGSRWVVL